MTYVLLLCRRYVCRYLLRNKKGVGALCHIRLKLSCSCSLVNELHVISRKTHTALSFHIISSGQEQSDNTHYCHCADSQLFPCTCLLSQDCPESDTDHFYREKFLNRAQEPPLLLGQHWFHGVRSSCRPQCSVLSQLPLS